MLSVGLIWCTFVALGDLFSSATAFWWYLNWSLDRSLTVTTFLKCLRGERCKYARKKVCLNWVSNSQPQGQESDTLTTEPSAWAFLVLQC